MCLNSTAGVPVRVCSFCWQCLMVMMTLLPGLCGMLHAIIDTTCDCSEKKKKMQNAQEIDTKKSFNIKYKNLYKIER